jgi:hypothetical protein
MPVTFDNAAAGIMTSTAETVATLTISTGCCLVACLSTKGSGGDTSWSSVQANGTALTQLGRFNNTSAGVVVTLFGLTAAPSGVVSISAKVTGAIAGPLQMYVASYNKAKSTGPFGTVIGGSASAVNNISISLSTSSTDMVVFHIAGVNAVTAMNATTRFNTNTLYGHVIADTAGSSAAISLSASAIITVQNIAFLGVNIAFSATAAPASGFIGGLTLMGVGQ